MMVITSTKQCENQLFYVYVLMSI